MSEWSGKTKGGKLGYSFFIFLIKNFNINLAYFFLKFAGLYFLLLSDKKAIKFYFNKIIGYKGFNLYKNIYKNYILLGEILIDKIAFLVKPDNIYTFKYDGEDYLKQMATEDRGGMLVGAHMGNWEVAGNLLNRIKVKVNVVLLDSEHKKIKSLFENHNITRNFNIISIKNDFSHLKKINQALLNKEFIVMHGDRYIDDTNAIPLNFMGKIAKFHAGPLYIASKYKVPVSFVFTLKEKHQQYHFYASKPVTFEYPANLKTRKQDIKNMLQIYINNLENMVKKYPLQWFNYFPYWEEEKV